VAFLTIRSAERLEVVLPAELVRGSGDSAIVYAITDDGRHVEARQVRLGKAGQGGSPSNGACPPVTALQRQISTSSMTAQR
jgi:hypothetical protein